MQTPDVRAFKNELRNLKYYQYRVQTLTNSMEWCYERLGGVRAIDPSKEPMHVAPNKELEYKLRDDIERYRALLALTETKIKYIDEILSHIETSLRDAIISVYVDGQHLRAVASKMYLSGNGLSKRINKAIAQALLV